MSIFFDIKKLNLKYDLFFRKFDKNIIKRRLYELKMWNYLHGISNNKKLKNMKTKIRFQEYDEIYCTDGEFVFENYLTVNQIPHIMMEHAKDVHIKKNYSTLAALFHYLEIILDRYNVTVGIGIASQYCTTMEVNSDKGKEMVLFLKKRKLLIWNVKDHIRLLSRKDRDKILDIYIESYVEKFDYESCYNILLTNPLYIDGDVASEEDQIAVYQKIIKTYRLNEGGKLLIKPHPRDNVNYTNKLNGIVIDNMISSEILCISQKLKKNKVATLYSSSADAFFGQAKKLIKIVDSEKEAIEYCRKILN